MGKGDTPRPRQVSREEVDLRWLYYEGGISKPEFDRRLAKIRSTGNDRKIR